MPSTADKKGGGNAIARPLLMIVGGDPEGSATWAASLEAQGCRVQRETDPSQALAILRNERPDALVLHADGIDPTAIVPLRTAARSLGIPWLEVVDEAENPEGLVARFGEADDWVFRSRAAIELPARAFRLLRRSADAAASASTAPLADARFFALVVHDLRTPLNVIGLSLRMIGQAIPKGDPDLDEDLRFIDENFKQIERMLTQLSDYCRLFESEMPLTAAEFSPRQLVDDLIESRKSKAGLKNVPIRLEIHDSCPAEASLDPQRAQMAIQYALANAAVAAGEGSVAVTIRGGSDRWITEIAVDRPPPSSVKPVALRSNTFERLCGSTAERRGMDLAISARISELFGGGARLDVVDNSGTVIVLDWPLRMPQPTS